MTKRHDTPLQQPTPIRYFLPLATESPVNSGDEIGRLAEAFIASFAAGKKSCGGG
jgi:hypothetical protein